MKLIKKINNNYVLALDSNGEQIIVEGKGIGFNKMPCEIDDLSIVTRTYYDTNNQDIALIQESSEELLNLCSKIFDYANIVVGERINPNLTFILADHIQFSIERYEKNIDIKMPIYYDIEYLYPKESKVAEYALQLIFEDLNILLPESEKTGIAMNVINSEISNSGGYNRNEDLVKLCTSVIEKTMNITIDKDMFNYSRFVTHLHYLFRRTTDNIVISSDNKLLYESISRDYPDIRKCVDVLENVLKKKKFSMNEEEKVYLMMHINRLCTREDCNRKGITPSHKN